MSIENRDNRAKIAIRACIQKVLLRADSKVIASASEPSLYPKRTRPTLAPNDLLIEATLPFSLVWYAKEYWAEKLTAVAYLPGRRARRRHAPGCPAVPGPVWHAWARPR
jgi:hypothetical protein